LAAVTRWQHSSASERVVLSNVPPTRITTLDNGMRVATEDSGSPTCTVSVNIFLYNKISYSLNFIKTKDIHFKKIIMFKE